MKIDKITIGARSPIAGMVFAVAWIIAIPPFVGGRYLISAPKSSWSTTGFTFTSKAAREQTRTFSEAFMKRFPAGNRFGDERAKVSRCLPIVVPDN